MRLSWFVTVGIALVCLSCAVAEAELIPLEQVQPPMVVANVAGRYRLDTANPGVGVLTLTGLAITYDTGDGSVNLSPPGPFSLSARIDKTTGEATSGTLSVKGNSQTLFYSTDLTDFGFGPVAGESGPMAGYGMFEFLFKEGNGGVLVAPGIPVGVLVASWSIRYKGSTDRMAYNRWSTFCEDFDIGQAKADTFGAVPAPSGVVLGGIGLGLVGWLRRRLGRRGGRSEELVSPTVASP